MGLDYESQKGKTLFIKEKGKTHQIKIVDIRFIEYSSPICSIFHVAGKISVYKPLKEYEELTKAYYFFKANKSTIVNLIHMTQFISKCNKSYILLDTYKIPVSRRRKSELNTILQL